MTPFGQRLRIRDQKTGEEKTVSEEALASAVAA